MKVFAIYTKNDEASQLEDIICVKQHFDFFAFLFGAMWLLYKRSWLFLGLYFVLALLLHQMQSLNMIDRLLMTIIQFALNIAIGIFAPDIQHKALIKAGYIHQGYNVASDKLTAAYLYLESLKNAK